jgi:hypothetical protein
MPARRRNRGTTTERGYGWAHWQERQRLKPIVATGTVTCARAALRQCLMSSPLILPGQPWDLGHPDHDRTRWSGPEHRRCNRAAAARIGNRTRSRPKRTTTPTW